jgi:hypothetical protein
MSRASSHSNHGFRVEGAAPASSTHSTADLTPSKPKKRGSMVSPAFYGTGEGRFDSYEGILQRANELVRLLASRGQ